MIRTTRLFSAAAFVLAMAGPVAAQSADSKACTEQERSNQTLSEKLGQTNGVICPPDVDSEMKAGAGRGQNAGYPAAGKSRRQSQPSAEIIFRSRIAAAVDSR